MISGRGESDGCLRFFYGAVLDARGANAFLRRPQGLALSADEAWLDPSAQLVK